MGFAPDNPTRGFHPPSTPLNSLRGVGGRVGVVEHSEHSGWVSGGVREIGEGWCPLGSRSMRRFVFVGFTPALSLVF